MPCSDLDKLWSKFCTLLSGNKEAITSLDQFKPAVVRHDSVHLVDKTKNGKYDEQERLVYEDKSVNNNHTGIIFLKPRKAVRTLKKIFRNYLKAQIYVNPIMKIQRFCLKSKRRDFSFLESVKIMTGNNHLDILARWTTQDLLKIRIYLLNIRCILNMYLFLIGWIQIIVKKFFNLVYHDKIRINFTMDCLQMDLLYLYKHFKDFHHEIEWPQIIQITLNIYIEKDTSYLFYRVSHVRIFQNFILHILDSADQTSKQYFQVEFSWDCEQIITCNMFNPLDYVMFNQGFKDFCTELNQKDCKEQCNKELDKLLNVDNECVCNSLSSQVDSCDAGLFETDNKFINDKIENGNRMLLEENKIIKGQLLEKEKFIEEMKRQLEFLESDKFELERKILKEIEDIRQELLEKDELIHKKTRQFEMLESETLSLKSKCLLLGNKLSRLQEEFQKIEKELKKREKDYKELILDYGRISVENDSEVNKVKKTEQFQKIFIPISSTSCVLDIKGNNSCNSGPMQNNLSQNRESLSPSSSSLSSSRRQSVGADGELLEVSEGQGNSQTKCEENGRDLNIENQSNVLAEQPRFSIEVVERDNEACISLMNQPSFSVPADVYNAYKLLLLTISDRLLYDDIIKLQEWAKETFSVQTNLNAYENFMELDKKGVISALNLSQLTLFFESIERHDVVHLIDEFKNGDYDKLRKLVFQNKRSRKVKNSNQVHSPKFRLPNSNTPGSPRRSSSNTRVNVSSGRVLEKPSAAEDNNPTSAGRDHQGFARFGSNFPSTSSSRVRSGFLMHENSENVPDVSAVTNTRGNPENEHRINPTDALLMTESVRHKQTLQSRQPLSHCNRSHNAAGRCSGAHNHTDAHLQGATNGNNQDNWLCDHYKRRCLVKFECCDKYWACHRCHNNESTCGHRKLKSRDTAMIKCVECGKEQKFGQFCVSCNTQFADFFCGICQHLTGTDDHPYHCDKCGICRIHGDRSYHCDVCGICLDVQLRGNHKCRPNSAHDECCICLEDAFTGCQILPCSHKVHKDCATQMIRMGITRCPICRESFAHKLERRPVKKKTARKR